MSAKDMRKQARGLFQMAQTIELMELAKSEDPQALQKHLHKKLERQLKNKVNAQMRKVMKKSLGI